MVRYRYYTKLFLGVLLLFILANLIVWEFWTKELLTSSHGDLARLSYLPKICQERGTGVDLPRRHVEIGDFTGGRVDMVTVGDSFSAGGGGGKNNYYQDYIASYNNFTVVNVSSNIALLKPGYFMPVNILAILYNNGMLDRLKPRYVLIETAEHSAVERLASSLNFNDTQDLDRMLFFYTEYRSTVSRGNDMTSFVNAGAKFVYYNIKDMLSIKKINNQVYRTNLSRTLFSGPYGDRLYYLSDEEKAEVMATRDKLQVMNDNLNLIADKLAKKNIKLVFMPVVNKLNLYGTYTVPPRNDTQFFDELRKMPKKYLLIDTKELLSDAIRRGDKDVFYKDDTHWSWKAPQMIFDAVRFD